MPKDQLLEAQPVSLLDLLDHEVVYMCPLFQRPYVWGKKEIEQLWADITTVVDGEYDSRFLGAIVLDTAVVGRSKRAAQHWIIDGQQRLTTLYLLLTAISLELAPIDRGSAKELVDTALLGTRGDIEGRPKLRPTLADSRQFSLLMKPLQEFGAELDSNVLGADEGDLSKALRRIQRFVRKFAVGAEERGKELVRLSEILLDNVEFVEISLGDHHDANEVFDRLNKEGRRLDIIDLVRNDVMRRSIDDVKLAKRLYDDHWRPFEDAFPDPKSRDRYFFPFVLTRDPSVTKSRTFHTLSDRWRDMTDGVEDPSTATTVVMKDLSEHVPAYVALETGGFAGIDSVDEQVRQGVERLHRLGAPSVSYSYLLQIVTNAIQGEVDAADAAATLAVVESFLFRRAVVGLEPTGLHAIFKGLWRQAGIDPKKVRASLDTATIQFPADEEFANAIRSGHLYGRNVCRYAIEEYERGFQGGDPWANLPEWTVDHVLPQHPEEDSSWWDAFTPAEHESLVNTWANLIPLSASANASKGTSGWEATREKLRSDSIFKSTTRVLNDFDGWDPTQVRARGEKIVTFALGRWPVSPME